VRFWDLIRIGSEYINLQIDSQLGNIVDMEVDGANFIIGIYLLRNFSYLNPNNSNG